jgi:putative acetyltransferase
VRVSTRALRAFVEADLPALIDLWVAAWSRTDFAIDFGARAGWLDGHLRALLASGVAIVVGLDADDRQAGFVTIDPRNGYLDQLCVAPSEQGSGLAIALFEEAKRISPGVIELDVNEANARAVHFYEREGFLAITRGLSAQSGLPTLRMRWRRGD